TLRRPSRPRTKLPHALLRGKRAPRGMGPILARGVFQPSPATVTHPTLDRGIAPSRLWCCLLTLAQAFGGRSAPHPNARGRSEESLRHLHLPMPWYRSVRVWLVHLHVRVPE